MGLFSSKHVFTAYAGSSALIEEENRTSTVMGLVLQAVVTEDTGITEAVKMGLQTNLYARARSMLRYAKREETGYVYGLPDSSHPGHGDYLPIVALMQDRVWFDETDQEQLELTTGRILKRLALDATDVKEQYIEQVEEGIASGERPGTDQLDDWDFFIQFAAPMHTRTRGTREYIHHFLSYLGGGNRSWTYRADYEAFLNGGETGDQPRSNFHLSEGEGANADWQSIGTGYQSFYAWSYIEENEVVGEYTPPGWDEPLKPNHCYSKIYQRSDADYAEGLEELHGAGVTLAPASSPETSYHTYAVFTQQGVDGIYRQVLIMAPSMMYIINTPSDDSPEADTFQYIDVPLFPEDPEQESEFRWPIRVENLKETATMHREELLQESLCATVFLVEEAKVKWYQKTFFKWLIVIIVIIVIIIAQQYHLLSTVKELAAAAFALGATGTAIAFAALYVAMVFALGFMISFAGSLIGGDLGKLFVIAATIYMAGVNPFANMSQAWGNLAGNVGFGTAISFIQAVQPILTVLNLGYSAYQTDKLEKEMEDFMKSAKEKYEELRDAYDMLGETPAGLDPLFITSIFTGHFPESPESYYNRSLNANPGVLGYDLINEFSSIALTLPEDGRNNDIVGTVMDSFARQRGAA